MGGKLIARKVEYVKSALASAATDIGLALEQPPSLEAYIFVGAVIFLLPVGV